MATYKGFGTSTPSPSEKMAYAKSLTPAQRDGLSPSEFVDAWDLGLSPQLFKARTTVRDRQAIKNLREPGQSWLSGAWQGAKEGFVIGSTGVKRAVIGAGVGLWHVTEDVGSNVGAGAHGLADDITGNIKDERKQVQKSNATYDRMKAAFEGATGSEEGGWLRSLVEAGGTAAGGQGSEALARLESIPTDELAGLDPNSPHFSENMASLGINIALFAAGARGSLLKAADGLEARAGKLSATGVAADATAAAKLLERAEVYRKIAALPKYAEKASINAKIIAASPRLNKTRKAWNAVNNFKNPVKEAKAADMAPATRVNASAVDAMKPGGSNTLRLGRSRVPDLSESEARQHQLTFNAAAGKMETVETSVFKSQMSQNRGAAALTPYTNDELASIELYKLKDGDVYYGIRPADVHPITGLPERDIVSVMNNDPHAKGLATPAAMLHAIEKGATTLDAFDVNGFLPGRYKRFGFEEIGREPYNYTDYGEPSDDLKEAWRKDGWKDSDLYPNVVYMKFGGKDAILDSIRSSARRNYLESRTVDKRGAVLVDRGTTRRLLSDDGRDSSTVGGDGVRSASPLIGRTDAQVRPDDPGRTLGLVTGIARRYTDLLGLSDDQLVRIGLDPWEVRTLPKPQVLPDDRSLSPSGSPDQSVPDQALNQPGANLTTLPWLLLAANIARNTQLNASPTAAHTVPPRPARPFGPSPSAATEANLAAMWREAL